MSVCCHIKAAISSSLVCSIVVLHGRCDKMRPALLIRLQLQVLVAMVTDAVRYNNYTAPSVINVGLLQPLEGPLGFERTGSAATMAVRDAQRRGYLNQTDIKYILYMSFNISLVLFFLTTQLCICRKVQLKNKRQSERRAKIEKQFMETARKRLTPCKALMGNPSQSYGASLAIWDHTPPDTSERAPP